VLIGVTIVAVVGLVAWAAFAVLGRGSSAAASKLIGQPVPSLTLPQLEGADAVALAEPGTVTVINFWAPWCVPCVGEHEMFNRVVPTYASSGVRFVGVAYQSDDADVSSFLDRVGRNVPTLRDANGLASIDFGVTGVPETFFVDRDGIVRYHVAGPVSEAKLHEYVDDLLAPAPA
jgi:cytochrome c biogenesis protein CcmG/thiol:disulfide interchange protein DsbE